jgi:hypothetical protein
VKDVTTLADVVPDPHSPNQGTARGAALLEQSIAQYGAGRGVAIDQDGIAIAGSKVIEAARAAGLTIKVVHTDGTKLVVAQRVDLDLTTDPAARELAYLDNRVSEVGLAWRPDQFEADLAAGVEFGTMFSPDEHAALLTALDDMAGRAVTLRFADADAADTWRRFLTTLPARYPAARTLGAQVAAWVTEVTAWLDGSVPEVPDAD